MIKCDPAGETTFLKSKFNFQMGNYFHIMTFMSNGQSIVLTKKKYNLRYVHDIHNASYCIAVHYAAVHHTAVHYAAVHHVTMQHAAVHYAAMHHSALVHHITMHHTVMLATASHPSSKA